MPIEFDRRATCRFGAGVSAAFAVSQFIAWPMCFVMPIFVAMFLQAPQPLPLRGVYILLAKSAGILALGIFLSIVFLPYPLVFSVLVVAGLFLIFKRAVEGASPLLVVVSLIAILLIPVVALGSREIALDVTGWLFLDMALGVTVAGLFFVLIPADEQDIPKPVQSTPADEREVIEGAIKMTIVVAPLALGFLIYGWSAVLTLIMAAILAQQLSASTGLQSGVALLVANIAGAMVAWLAYNILVAAPSFPIMVLLAVVVSFLAGACFFSNKKALKLAGSANNAFLILLGGSLAPFGDDVEAKISERIYLIALAVLYVVIVFQIIEGLHNKQKADSNEQQTA